MSTTPPKTKFVPTRLTHGHSYRGKKSPTYKIWESMIRRCYMPSQPGYMNYGGRGIKVYEPWRQFVNFLADMGEKPEGMTLDRIESDSDYGPFNCRWIPPVEQARNKRNTYWVSFGGKTQALSAWAEELGIGQKTLRARLVDHGWPVERALTTPVMTVAESTALAHAEKKRRVCREYER